MGSGPSTTDRSSAQYWTAQQFHDEILEPMGDLGEEESHIDAWEFYFFLLEKEEQEQVNQQRNENIQNTTRKQLNNKIVTTQIYFHHQ
jgi:hypothetical protein